LASMANLALTYRNQRRWKEEEEEEEEEQRQLKEQEKLQKKQKREEKQKQMAARKLERERARAEKAAQEAIKKAQREERAIQKQAAKQLQDKVESTNQSSLARARRLFCGRHIFRTLFTCECWLKCLLLLFLRLLILSHLCRFQFYIGLSTLRILTFFLRCWL
jgi:Flp pilus assembly protein TadB